MSSEMIWDARKIRSVLGAERITRRELSRQTGIKYWYLVQILNNQRDAAAKRLIITEYLQKRLAA